MTEFRVKRSLKDHLIQSCVLQMKKQTKRGKGSSTIQQSTVRIHINIIFSFDQWTSLLRTFKNPWKWEVHRAENLLTIWVCIIFKEQQNRSVLGDLHHRILLIQSCSLNSGLWLLEGIVVVLEFQFRMLEFPGITLELIRILKGFLILHSLYERVLGFLRFGGSVGQLWLFQSSIEKNI